MYLWTSKTACSIFTAPSSGQSNHAEPLQVKVSIFPVCV